MISTEDLYKEINKYDELTKDSVTEITDLQFKQAMIKVSILQAKLLHNLRTNTVRVMDHLKVPKAKPRNPRGHDNREQTTEERT